MFIIILCFTAIIGFILFKHIEHNKKYADIAKIPGPPPIWFFGNALQFGKCNREAFEKQISLTKEYGSMVRVWMGTKLTLLLSDPDKIEYILSSNKHIDKSYSYDGWQMWLGNGLINSSGNYWRKHRKAITPAFHFKILEQFVKYMNSNGKIMVEKLKIEAGKKSFDIFPYINYYNLDLISESAMQTNINAQVDPKVEYLFAVKTYLDIHFRRIFSFFKRIHFLFKLSHDYRLLKKSVETLHTLTRTVIKARKEERNNMEIAHDTDEFGIKKKAAFLDMLLDLENFTDEEIREEVDTFMFAGHDTLTTTSIFCLYELAENPEIQKRLLEEIDSIVGRDTDSDLKFQQIQSMQYLDRVVKEGLRKYATAPFIERELASDITFDGLTIPKGTTITIFIYALQMCEKYFPEPEKFDPDRFLLENVAQRHNFAYIPFSAGPRNCIGQRFALLATKATLINILRNFEILPAEPKFVPILANVVVLKSENGMHVQLKKRQ